MPITKRNMETREEAVEVEEVIVVAEVEIIEEGAVGLDLGGEEEAEAMVEVITMMMTDILTDKVIVTEAEVCMTPWSASRGPTTRLTRT